MDVAPELLKCVAYVTSRTRSGDSSIVGTCFFVSRPTPFPGLRFPYVVTARHVVDGVLEIGAEVCLRLNTRKDGAQLFPITNPWVFHTDNDVDIAIAEFSLDEGEVDHLTIPWSVIEPEPINNADPRSFSPGDDVLIIGLFHKHAGTDRNIPIVRLSSIAALPEERVWARVGSPHNPRAALVDAYLLESRSQSGLSGSPAFVYETREANMRGLQVQGTLYSPRARRPIYFLGLVKGHFDNEEATMERADGQTKANVGISIAVPYNQVVETFTSSKIPERESAEIKAYCKARWTISAQRTLRGSAPG